MKCVLLCVALGLIVLTLPLHAVTTEATAQAPEPAPASASNTLAATDNAATGASSQAAAPQRLSLLDALARARQNSPVLRGNAARTDVALARLRAARASPNPVLILAQPFGSNTTGGFDEGVVVSQTIEIGKRGPRSQAAYFELKSVQSDGKGRQTALEFDVASAYYETQRAQAELDLAQNTLDVAQKFDQATQIQLQAGDAPRQNNVRSSIELSRAQQGFRSAQIEHQNRLATLKSLTGIAADEPLQLSDTLAFAPQNFDPAVLQQLALQNRPELQSARADLQSRQAAISSAQAARLPDAFVEARRAALVPQSGQSNGNSIRVGVTLPLLDRGTIKSSVAEARAGAQEGQTLLAEAQRTAALEVGIALANFQNAQAAVQSFDAGRLAKSKELLEMAQIGYEQGATNYLELLDAQTVYRTEQVDYARALAAWNIALADLKRAVGGELPDDVPGAAPNATLGTLSNTTPSSAANAVPDNTPAALPGVRESP